MAANVSNTGRANWSNSVADYELKETIGYGATAVVMAAVYLVTGEKVAIKRIDLEKCGADIDEMRKEIQTMSRCNHENVVNYYTSFIVKSELWIVMKLLDGGSVLDIIRQLIKNGQVDPLQGVLDEIVIATILREVLKGLEYFHKNGQIHRDVKAGNILLGGDGSVQLADFGVSSTVVEYTERGQKLRNTFVGTPCWMAPEIMEQTGGYNYKVDIWSFGITALELATGTAPYSQFPAMKVLMLTLEGEPPTLETCSNGDREAYKKYSKQFRKMIASCLQKEPSMRPDATELLKNQFFKKAKSKEYLIPNLIDLAPKLHERGKKPRQKPQSMDRSKDNADDWEFGSGTEDDTAESPAAESKESTASKQAAPVETPKTAQPKEEQKQPAPSNLDSAATETPVQTATTTSPTTVDVNDVAKVFDLTLRLRNASKELNDIRFEFNTKNDSVEGVSQELMSAGLIDGKDLLIVGANMNKMIASPPESKSLTFALKSDETNTERDEKNLIGYAMLTLNS